jgi:hypothetical protein
VLVALIGDICLSRHEVALATAESPEPATTGAESERGSARRVQLALPSLLLDPNNYRFRDEEEWRRSGLTDIAKVGDARIQERTLRLILGIREANVQDLLASLRQNGWVDVEPIHVRKLPTGNRFLVIEGNRRVAALKFLQSRGDLGALDEDLFRKVPCLDYPQGSEQSDLLIMGLHHISGKRSWPALNQAEMLDELRRRFGKSPEEICRSLGISKREFNLSVRSLALCRAYQSSDYGDEFSKEKYNLFRETLRTPSVRRWLDWDDVAEVANNQDNLNLLFSWLSTESRDEEGDDPSTGRQERTRREPILNTAANIKELGRIVEDPGALRALDESGSIQRASLSSTALLRSQVETTMERAEADTGLLLQRLPHLSDTDLGRIEGLVDRYRAVLSARGRLSSDGGLVEAPWATYNADRRSHLRQIVIHRYRGMVAAGLEQLERVNLIVGINNAGKTSLLEAIQILCSQADPRSLMEVARRRVRGVEFPAADRMVAVLPTEIDVSGTFDDVKAPQARVVATIGTESANPTEDRAVFVAEAELVAQYGDHRQRVRTVFSTRGLPRIELVEGVPRWLCAVAFSSPFVPAPVEALRKAYEVAVGVKDEVIRFIKSHAVPELRDIVFVGERFVVLIEGSEEPLDLAAYGEGTQRVFHLALMMASARDGVLLVDEFENALHTGLQGALVSFLAALARHFNVQVFVTTHSLEAVDAWLGVDPQLVSSLAAYSLQRDGDRTQVLRFAGPDLRIWRQSIALDPRWPR